MATLPGAAAGAAWRYGLAVLAVAVVLVLRLLLQPWLGLAVPYLQFFPAIMLVARVSGFGPGVLATVLSSLAATFFFLPPLHTLRIDAAADRISLPLFVAIGVAIVALTESLRRSEQANREAATAASARARELDAVFEAIPDGVWVGRDGRITHANYAALRMLGASAPEELQGDIAELVGKLAPRSATSGRPLAPAELPFTRALAGEAGRDEVVVRRLDTQADLYLRTSAAPVRGDEGIVGAVVVNADITQSRESAGRLAAAAAAVAAAQTRLAEVVANVPGVVWEAWGEPDAASQRIDFVSDHVWPMLGYAPSEWTSTPNFWLALVHPDDQARAAREAAEIFASGRQGRSEFRWVRRDGSIVWVEAHSNVITDAGGRPVGMRGVTLDISARKQLELERAELLAREQAARAEAVAANRLKDDFLATLSHELRTPLNAILGYARMLRSGAIEAARQPRALEIVERNAAALTQMVEEVLDVSRVTAGKIQLKIERLDLCGVVEEAVATVRPAAEAKGIVLEAALDPGTAPVQGDPDRLQQIAWNLLSNALRFTPGGGRVHVQVRRDGPNAEVVVADTGEGIDPDFLPHVFERFRQADSRPSREYGGLGLGLAIARDLAEMHGGTILAASQGRGRGATFTVRLPLDARAGA